MNKTVGNVTLILIAAIWGFLIYNLGLNGFTIFFGIIGTLTVGAGVAGWTRSKGEMYLANKYDESKKQ